MYQRCVGNVSDVYQQCTTDVSESIRSASAVHQSVSGVCQKCISVYQGIANFCQMYQHLLEFHSSIKVYQQMASRCINREGVEINCVNSWISGSRNERNKLRDFYSIAAS